VEGVPEHEEIIADAQGRVEWFFAAVGRPWNAGSRVFPLVCEVLMFWCARCR